MGPIHWLNMGWVLAADLAGPPDPQHAYEYEATPAVLYIPVESTPLVPASLCPIAQGGQDNAALGCVAGLQGEETYEPPADPMGLVDALEAALAPYDVRVTTERPPPYVPYMMLLPSDEVDMEATSRTCASGGIDCDGPRRNDIAFTRGGTANCTNPDPIQVALIAFGYLSGLENNDDPSDPMFYPPQFDAPSHVFANACATLVPTLDEEGEPNLPVCVGLYHEVHCDNVDGSINSDAELRGIYGDGPPPVDVTPPSVDAIGIDGVMELPSGTPLPLTATVTDDSGLVFVRWTLRTDSGLLDDFDDDGDGAICKGHNDVCELAFGGEVPYFQNANGNYSANELSAVPDGVYEVTFEASDLAGNAVEIGATIYIGVSGESSGTDPDPDTGVSTTDEGGDVTSSPGDDDAGPTTADPDGDGEGEVGEVDGEPVDDDDGDDDGDDDTTTSAGATDAVASRGCTCGVADDRGAPVLFGLLALGWRRRRSR